ncbi:hypothetical protein [Brevibacterium gallinarum]|uniref:Uncharacterized protein n=1 Tax=Brevibacterium gallinarum TaxID=2762220 RepID=A0ABR8WR18_9MICO|nr:hypothetical protein [Brevibacterium gallinarum]MBD8019398.1 hypothetical protein [Brevibacterium gallinarum]
MDDFMQMLKDLAGPTFGIGGIAGMFVYFRRSERELRDELRADNERLRVEVTALRAELARVEAENDALHARLRGEAP